MVTPKGSGRVYETAGPVFVLVQPPLFSYSEILSQSVNVVTYTNLIRQLYNPSLSIPKPQSFWPKFRGCPVSELKNPESKEWIFVFLFRKSISFDILDLVFVLFLIIPVGYLPSLEIMIVMSFQTCRRVLIPNPE